MSDRGFHWAINPSDGGRLATALLIATFALELADTVRDFARGEYRPPEILWIDCVEMCDTYHLPVKQWAGTSCTCMTECDEDGDGSTP